MIEPGAVDTVELRLPAASSYVPVVRTTASALAARLSFTMDDIEDLRIVVTEALALALTHAAEGAGLEIAFRLEATRVQLDVSVATSEPATIDPETFAWQVLDTLSTCTVESAGNSLTLHVTVTSTLAPGS